MRRRCSVEGSARRFWQGMDNYRLDTLCRRIGYSFRHHDAREDAAAAGFVYLAMVRESGCATHEEFAERIRELAALPCNPEAWEDTRYHPNRQNLKDRIVCASENIGYDLAEMLKLQGLTNNMHPYLESHVQRVLRGPDA